MGKWLDGVMGAVVGDALGVPVEFNSREALRKSPVVDMMGYGTYDQPPGTWSDDSSMILATLASLQKGYDPEDMMKRFANWMVHGQYTPYGEAFDVGNGTKNAIVRYLMDGNSEHCGGDAVWENGNGSLMRILPAALYCVERAHDYHITWEMAFRLIHRVSGLTHRHLRSQIACGIYMMICNRLLFTDLELKHSIMLGVNDAFLFYEKLETNAKELSFYHRLKDVESFAALPETSIKSSGYVVDTLEAALWCLLNTSSYEECVLKAVNLGEDTDTVASIAGGLAGLYYGYDQIPEAWKCQIPRRDWIEKMCHDMEDQGVCGEDCFLLCDMLR